MMQITHDAVTGINTISEVPDDKYVEPLPPVPTATEVLQAEIITLKSRLAKIEAVPIVKETLEPIAIISK